MLWFEGHYTKEDEWKNLLKFSTLPNQSINTTDTESSFYIFILQSKILQTNGGFSLYIPF